VESWKKKNQRNQPPKSGKQYPPKKKEGGINILPRDEIPLIMGKETKKKVSEYPERGIGREDF